MAVATRLNVELDVVPMLRTDTMQTTAISESMIAYSTVVGPSSSAQNDLRRFSVTFVPPEQRRPAAVLPRADGKIDRNGWDARSDLFAALSSRCRRSGFPWKPD